MVSDRRFSNVRPHSTGFARFQFHAKDVRGGCSNPILWET